MRVTASAGLAAAVLLATLPSFSEEPSPLPLREAQRIARERDASLATVEEHLDALHGGWRSALQDPLLRYRYGEFDETSPLPEEVGRSRRSHSWDLRVYVPHPWVLSARSRVQQAVREELSATLEHARQSSDLDVLGLYREIQYAERDLVLAQELAKARRGRMESLDALNREGLADAPTTLSAAARHTEAQAAVRQLQSTLRHLRRALATRLGVNDADTLRLDAFAPMTAPPNQGPLPHALLKEASERDPDLSSIRSRIARARASLREREANSIPWLSYLQGEIGQAEEQFQERDSWSVRAAMEIPIFSRWARGREPERGEIARFETEYQVRAQRLESDLREAWALWNGALAAQADLQELLQPLIAKLAAATDPAQAESVPLDLLAELSEQQASIQRQVLEAQQEAHRAHQALSALLGRPCQP